jgi:UDP-N-acetyl-D-glucosamine dehydrogenase
MLKMKSVKLTQALLKRTDLVLLVTDHSVFDYAFIAKHARCIVDTRNAFKSRGIKSRKIYRA